MAGFDEIVLGFSVASAIVTLFFLIVSPENIYAYLLSPIVLYYVMLSHSTKARRIKNKYILDIILAVVLGGIIAYRAYLYFSIGQ